MFFEFAWGELKTKGEIMAEEKKDTCNCCSCPCSKNKSMMGHGSSGAIYGLGLLGGVFYFIQHATTFWGGVLGFFEGVFWPAVLVHKALELLKM